MPMLLPPMLLLLLLPLPLALGAGAAATAGAAGAADAACPGFVLKQGYGMTHQGDYATFATADAPACCAKCAAAGLAVCNSWFHRSDEGRCILKLRAVPDTAPEPNASTFSAGYSSLGPAPGATS